MFDKRDEVQGLGWKPDDFNKAKCSLVKIPNPFIMTMHQYFNENYGWFLHGLQRTAA